MQNILSFLVLAGLILVFSCTNDKPKRAASKYAIKYDTITKNGLITNYYELSGQRAQTGKVANGQRDSTWRYYSTAGYLTKSGDFVNGNKHGEWLAFNSDSQIIERKNFTNGILEGEFIDYYLDGKVKMTANYKNGKYHGKVVEYFENGATKLKTQYNNGLKEGKSLKYNEAGILLEEANYKSDELHGYRIAYDASGLLEEKTAYKYGKKHGSSVLYDYIASQERHYRSQEGHYKDDMKNGLFKYYDYYYDIENNTLGTKLILTGSEVFSDDKLHGPYMEYDPKEGFLLIETKYVNGVEHGVRKSYCPHGRDKGKLYSARQYSNGHETSVTYHCECRPSK